MIQCLNTRFDISSKPVDNNEIAEEAQRYLATIRTDLDAFSEVEAFSLMFSGYQMAEREFRDALHMLPLSHSPTPHTWVFAEVGKLICRGNATDPVHQELLRHLRVSSQLTGRVWMLHPKLRILVSLLTWGAALGVAAISILVAVEGTYRDTVVNTLPSIINELALATTVVVVAVILWLAFGKLIKRRGRLTRILLAIGSCLGTAPVVKTYTFLLDRLYLHCGRLEYLRKGPGKKTP